MEGFGFLVGREDSAAAAIHRVAATFELDNSTEVIKHSSRNLRMVACVQAPERVAVDIDDQFLTLRIGDVWLDTDEGVLPKHVPTPSEMFECWRTDGPSAMNRFDGCWSLVACDLHNQTAVLVTDRFNSHPIYWSASGKYWTVGSTVQSAALGRAHPIALDTVSIFQFIHFTRLFGTRTVVEGIQVTKPGSWIELGSGTPKVGTWFSFDYTPESRSIDYWADSLANAFRAATKNVVVPGDTGLLLSGGLDSRLVLASADPPINCLQVNDSFNNEARTAKALADVHGSPFQLETRPIDHYITIVQRAAALGSGSFNFHHAHCLGMRQIQHNKALIHGWAPELYFRGTTLPRRHVRGLDIRSPFVETITPTNVVDQMFYNLQYSQSSGRPSRVLRSELQNHYQSALHQSLHEVVDEARNHSENPLDWYLWPDTYYQARYPSHLWSISLRAENRERSVTMQNAILALHLRMPMAMRSNNDVWLHALQRLNSMIAEIPDANTGYRPAIPPNAYLLIKSVRWGRKRARKLLGLSSNPGNFDHSWLTDSSWPDSTLMFADYPPFRNKLRNLALSDGILPGNVFDMAALNNLFEEVRAKKDWHAIQIVFAAATLGSWIRQFA